MPNSTAAVLPLATFAFVMSITPGPNNLMLLSSGARFGLRLSLAHLLGVASGFIGLLIVCWFGVGALVLADARVATALTLLCVGYLVWLGWQLLTDRGPTAPLDTQLSPSKARPLRWLEAVAFQFVNPKAWGMGVTAVSIVHEAPRSLAVRLAMLLLVCGLINLPCVALWTVFGAAMRQHLGKPWVRRTFNGAMATAVMATALWMLWPLTVNAPR
jgi:threonine/homoserine/homoserine lactone efflux protein